MTTATDRREGFFKTSNPKSISPNASRLRKIIHIDHRNRVCEIRLSEFEEYAKQTGGCSKQIEIVSTYPYPYPEFEQHSSPLREQHCLYWSRQRVARSCSKSLDSRQWIDIIAELCCRKMPFRTLVHGSSMLVAWSSLEYAACPSIVFEGFLGRAICWPVANCDVLSCDITHPQVGLLRSLPADGELVRQIAYRHCMSCVPSVTDSLALR